MSNSFQTGFCIILSFFYTTCFSQIYNFRTYTEDNGLPQNYIYSISQSKNGFLYLSTGNGFAAFGGNKFKSFTIKDSLCENFVNIHFTDSKGIIWLGHYQNGISFLKNNKFYKIRKSETLGSKVISFAEDKQQNIWFIVQGKGLYYIDSTLQIQKPSFNEEYFFNCICIDNTGKLITGTDNGLLIFDIKNKLKPELLSNIIELENKNVKFITCDATSNGHFWIAIPGEGIFGIKQYKTTYKLSLRITTDLNSLTKNILSIYSDQSSNLWVSIADEGLRKIKFSNNNDFYTVSTINKVNGLPDLYIQSICQDYENNMWFGTFGAGLIEMPIEKFSFFKPEFNSNISSILIDNSYEIFLGTSNGLLLYNKADSSKTKLFNSINGFVNDKINAIFKDKSGTIWIGTDKNGIYNLDTKSWVFSNFSKQNKLDILSINSITQNLDRQILVGTRDGAYFINPKTFETVLITTYEGLLHNNVNSIYCDKRNRIWFCSNGAPPYYLEKNEFNALKNIPTISVSSVVEDINGLIWISTEGDGVFSYDGENIRNFRVEDGLMSNFCYSIVCNNINEIWLTHKNGLTCIKNSGNSILRFGKSDGLLFNENNSNSYFKDIKGNLWFGTTEGLVFYNSDKNTNKIIEPRAEILQITLNNIKFTIDKKIEMPYSEYNVKIDFIGISLTDPQKVKYKYRLLGFDTLWRFTSDRVVEYPKLTDGLYTFQVVACNRDGVWNSDPKEISFKIDAPYWKRIWFWFLITLFITGIIYLFILIRIRNLVKAKIILEKKVEIKTLQLREEKEQIEKIKLILEEKNKDITDSINYAKKIQIALLPSKDNLLKAFPKAFIFFRPRDIVSGDFYWFEETNDSYIIAVVDCTGHGVPGAFMSLIGSTLMNEIVNNKKITTPAEILTELNRDVIKALSQDVELISSRDGMDISIASIDKSKTKMIYSSAARPMYYVRNQSLNIVNLKTHSIGSSYTNKETNYYDVEIDIFPNDIFYFFSDGFADQFDKNDEKKFSSGRLKNMFTKIADQEACNQLEMVENILNNWKGNQRQIDDITIIGLKI